ncbi:uricase-like isoform X1 [Acropora muricata]|uniref:uricase-like isoform X1 n=1 Tax=Acropora muricata TaxID=159855 RepID=UPI0034E4E0EB
MSSSLHIDPSFTGYGKAGVRLLKIKRNGKYHSIKQIEVSTELKLNNYSDYLYGDNASVVPTDTQKNTVYALAKEHQLNTIEEFALHVSNYFLTTHMQVEQVSVEIEETPWRRIKQKGIEHAHAFIFSPEVIRFCSVTHARGGEPKVSGGFKEMKILKTTQSGFTGFCKDKYTILPESTDRSFCTNVYCRYYFDGTKGVDFDSCWNFAKNTILDEFAGPPQTGVYSPSVQNTLYKAEERILNNIPQSESSGDIATTNVGTAGFDFQTWHDILVTLRWPCQIFIISLLTWLRLE